MKTTIDRAGRVVIPKAVRETAGLAAGTELTVRCRDGVIELEPQPARIQLLRKGPVVVARLPGMRKLTAAQVRRTLEAVRQRR